MLQLTWPSMTTRPWRSGHQSSTAPGVQWLPSIEARICSSSCSPVMAWAHTTERAESQVCRPANLDEFGGEKTARTFTKSLRRSSILAASPKASPRERRFQGAPRAPAVGEPGWPSPGRGGAVVPGDGALQRRRPAPGPGRQPHNGDHLRRADPEVQRGAEREPGRALHASRRRPLDGRPAGCRRQGAHPTEGCRPHRGQPVLRVGRDADDREGPHHRGCA